MRKTLVVLLTAIAITTNLCAQTKLSKDDIAAYNVEIRQMIRFLESTFNFIGDTTSLPSEKEIIFNESYIKIFKDENVQIEDDLDENRTTNVSKEVQAYLKDIDFFYKTAKFNFEIESIQDIVMGNGDVVFKVEMIRHLRGVNINNEVVDNFKQRFVEINLDPKNNGLKIASIYTTRLDETEEMCVWWNSLNATWRKALARNVIVNDSLPLANITELTKTSFKANYPIKAIESNDTIIKEWREEVFKTDMTEIFNRLKNIRQVRNINLQGMEDINSVEPLSGFTELTMLNISKTRVTDLSPLRNAMKLKTLNASNTDISDLSPLRYCSSLSEIELINTDIKDISVLYMLSEMERLNISGTKVTDISPIASCPKMTHFIFKSGNINNIEALRGLNKLLSIDISNSQVSDINALENNIALQNINISGTRITDIKVLQKMENLKELYCSNTGIKDLLPLAQLHKLSRVYCDKTAVTANEAEALRQKNPHALVVYDTDALANWWRDLSIIWRSIFSEQMSLDREPTTEELHSLINMKSLDIHDKSFVQNIDPLSKLTALETLNVANTDIIRLTPLFGMTSLKALNIENTKVSNLKPLEESNSLHILNISNTNVENLEPLSKINSLGIIIANNVNITTNEVVKLKENLPNVTVIYQTEKLERWWANLDTTWKKIMKENATVTGTNPTALELQRMIDIRKLDINTDDPINNLEPLANFEWIESLNIANQGISDLRPIAHMKHLKELFVQDNPISDLSPLLQLNNLEVLNISNTLISNLEVVAALKTLKTLNASGTSIKSLKPLLALTELEELVVNNTPIKSYSPVDKMTSLKTLKIYNTKITNRAYEDLLKKRIDLEIKYH